MGMCLCTENDFYPASYSMFHVYPCLKCVFFCLEQDQWHTTPPNHVSLSPTHSTPKQGGKGNFIIILKIAFCSFTKSTPDYHMMSCVLSTLPFWLMNSSNHSLNCCPELRQYLDKFVIPASGDWPTWFYKKKLIAQEMNQNSPLLSFIPEQGPFHVFLNLTYHVIPERI